MSTPHDLSPAERLALALGTSTTEPGPPAGTGAGTETCAAPVAEEGEDTAE